MTYRPVFTDADLYHRGAETLLASWEEYARGATGAAVSRLPGVAVAVFAHEPERAVYNNALLVHGLVGSERIHAIDAMEAAYAAAGVTHFAAWVHESDKPMCEYLERHGYSLHESTLAMGMALDDIRVRRPELELASGDWNDYLSLIGVPPDFLRGADRSAYYVQVVHLAAEKVATAMAFDVGGDCGIFNVVTVERVRRRGLGTALTALQAHDARARGCRTASLQSTEMAERVYAAVGFRDLGRILEYVPSATLNAVVATPPLQVREIRGPR